MRTRLARAWRAMEAEQRLVALAALALLVTMFFPWYGLQSLNRKTGVIYSHSISAFGDVSFVEAAIFLVAVGVSAIVFARGDGRRFHLPGGDGVIVTIAGAWAALLIFYRVFDRPDGGGYPVGIEWGFFLAFVAAGCIAFAGWRMRAGERREAPLRSRRPRSPRREPSPEDGGPPPPPEGDITVRASMPRRTRRAAPAIVPSDARAPSARSPYPPAPHEQLSFEDPPTRAE